MAPATETFTGNLERTIGTTKVEIRALPKAHTSGDCVVLFPDRKVAAVGDVFAKGSAPWADQFMGDGSMEGVLTAQDSLLAWIPDSTWAIVTGHGPIARRPSLEHDRRALADVRACVQQARKAGRNAAAIAEDCAGSGFEASQGDYAAWLFLEEWNRSGKSHKRPMTIH